MTYLQTDSTYLEPENAQQLSFPSFWLDKIYFLHVAELFWICADLNQLKVVIERICTSQSPHVQICNVQLS